MNRKIAAAIAALCIIAVLGAAGSIAYRVISGGEAGREAAEADFSGLLSTASAARSASDLGSQELRGELAARFSSSPSLLAAEIYQGGSTIWRMPAESPYPLGASADSARLPASALRLSAPLGFGTPGAAMLDAVYVRVSQLSVFTAFRDALVFLAGFLALASMAAAIASRPRRRGPEYAPAAGPSLGEEEEEAEAERPRRKARPKKRQAKTAQREIEELFAVEDESPASSAAASSFGAASSSGAAARGPEPKPAYEPIEEAEELDAEPLWDAEPSWAAEPASTAAPAAAPSSSAKASSAAKADAHDFEPAFFEEPVDEILFSAPEPSIPGEATPVEDAEADDMEPFDIPRIDLEEELARDHPAAAPSRSEIDEIEELPDIDLEPASSLAETSRAGGGESGVLPEEGMIGALDSAIRQAARSSRDLSLLVLTYDDLSPIVPEYASFVAALRESLGGSGEIFARGRSGFAALLPGADSRRALSEAEELFRRLDFLSGGDVGELHLMPLFLGISSLAGREIEAGTFLNEAEAALERAREDPDSHIVAFRPDPERYREFLRKKSG